MALAKAQSLAGQFRRSDADDPRTFAAAWAVVMADFPPCVLDHVCHPAKGLASAMPFLPSVFEVREACVAHYTFLLAQWANAQIPPEQKQAIFNRDAVRHPALPPAKRRTRRELEAKYGPGFGLDPDADPLARPRQAHPFTPPTVGEIVAHYTKHKRLGIPLDRAPGDDHHGQDRDEEIHHDQQAAEAGRLVADADAPGGGA